jgi:anaerobic ribonucleoside-triphosphate reductase
MPVLWPFGIDWAKRGDAMGLLDILRGFFRNEGDTLAKKKFKCPNCGYYPITLDMERCPNCGVRIKSMFRKKCPKCGELNELDAKVCVKCGYDFEAEIKRATKTIYRCPICGYESDVFFTVCPVCGTRMA